MVRTNAPSIAGLPNDFILNQALDIVVASVGGVQSPSRAILTIQQQEKPAPLLPVAGTLLRSCLAVVGAHPRFAGAPLLNLDKLGLEEWVSG